MVAKACLVVFVQALFIQCIYSQCIGAPFELAAGAPWGASWAGGPYAAPWGAAPLAGEYPGYAAATLAASNGGGFAVSSVSPIVPTGVFVTSENAYDGALAVAGQLPFLSAVALEGALPSVGAGAISYGCGNGNVAILSEDLAPAYGPGPYEYGAYGAYGAAPFGFNGPIGFGAGCGCGALY